MGYDDGTDRYAGIDTFTEQTGMASFESSSYTVPVPARGTARASHPYDYPYAMAVKTMRTNETYSGYIDIIEEPCGECFRVVCL